MGIVGGAIAALVGALFGGSKYQVYGPTAAFIPIIAGLMAVYSHGFLVLASILAGVILVVLGLARLGRVVTLVPHSIVIGFTIGIAVTIAVAQAGEMFGLPKKLGPSFADKISGIADQVGFINWYAVAIAGLTFLIIKSLLRVSVFIPAPLIALGAAVLISNYLWHDKGLVLIRDRYGAIPSNLLVFTGPVLPELSVKVVYDLCYFVLAIVFVSGIESLLCSRMADRLADNQGTPYSPNKELWGQGWVQIIVPLINGFPHTGALARTAANIKLGAISPLAGVFKCVLKLLLAYYLATFLGTVPMACIGGLLLYVATGMVKIAEVRQVLEHNRFHIALMTWTAVAVIATDFLVGVLSAIVLYVLLRKFLDGPARSWVPAPDLSAGSAASVQASPATPATVSAPAASPFCGTETK
jgi:sulfate permease, SulP family